VFQASITASILTAALFFNSTGAGDRSAYGTPREAIVDRFQKPAAEPPLRVAVVGFGRKPSALEKTLKDELSRSDQIAIVEDSRVEFAVAGIAYDGSINMSMDEARRLGAAIGCDFFIIVKAEVVARSEAANQSHQEANLGVLIVDGRRGSLALFDLVTAKAGSTESALNLISKFLSERIPRYVETIREFRAARISVPPAADSRTSPDTDRVEDLPEEGSPRSIGFQPPQFLNRVKPEYTAEAERADISATVEANVVLRANGEIGDIEILRWAGFGLDESAVRAIRQLKFKAATRDGKAVSVRALIRYNFRRIVPDATDRR
jgi:TonB family protein